MSRRGFDDERWIKRKRPAVALVILLPDRTNASDVLGLATGQVGFIDGDINARTAELVKLQNFSAVRRAAGEAGVMAAARFRERLECEIPRRGIEQVQKPTRRLALDWHVARDGHIADANRDDG